MRVSSFFLRDDYSNIIGIVTETLETFLALPGGSKSESIGGYFTVMSVKTGLVLLIVPIGEMFPEKIQKYFELSQEKARRLLANQPHGISSWQTRDTELYKYGGAVKISTELGGDEKGEGLILSFSGLPEYGDEAIMLYTAIRGFDSDVLEAMKIAKISGNPFLIPLLAKIHA